MYTKYKLIAFNFRAFGELRTVRLPKKVAGTGVHRGFGFVDFITHHDAKVGYSYIPKFELNDQACKCNLPSL